MCDSLWPHESQHTRPPCPSPTPRVYSNPCPLSRWCHPTISSSVVPFSSCPQSVPADNYYYFSLKAHKLMSSHLCGGVRGAAVPRLRGSVQSGRGWGRSQIRAADQSSALQSMLINNKADVLSPVQNPPALWETLVWSLGWEDPLEKGKSTHSSILAWRIPWTV